MSATESVSGVGPDLALSSEEREQVEEITGAIDAIPTLTRNQLEEKYFDQVPSARLWADEVDGAAMLEADHQPKQCKLPGFGSMYEDCGARIPHACEHCGHLVEIGRTCARSECPRCGSRWVTKRAPRLVSRIYEAARMKEGAQYLHHGVISPPKDFFADVDDSEEALEKLYQFGHEFMGSCDMDGIMVYHPYRGASDKDDAREAHEDDRGEWKNRIFENRSWKDVRSELEFSPHLHVIGCTSWFPGGDVIAEIYDQTGWIIHRITERNGSAVSLGDIHSLSRAVTYALSHCGIDMTGEQNKSEYRKHGSAFHAADCRSIDKATDAVHRVAPDTLGVASQYVECRNDVHEDDCAHDHDHDHHSDGSEADSDRTSDSDPGMTTCRGALRDFNDVGDLLERPSWRKPIHPTQLTRLEQVHAIWEEVGGWRGWVDRDQSRISDPPD